jgi:DNA-binding NtrC family response regulator
MTRPIIVIDDCRDHLDFLVTLLERSGYRVIGYSSAREALKHVAGTNAALVITDIFMPEIDGVEVVCHLRRAFPELPVIGIGGLGLTFGEDYLDAMQALGAAATFEKPVDPSALLAAVARLVGHRDN